MIPLLPRRILRGCIPLSSPYRLRSSQRSLDGLPKLVLLTPHSCHSSSSTASFDRMNAIRDLFDMTGDISCDSVSVASAVKTESHRAIMNHSPFFKTASRALFHRAQHIQALLRVRVLTIQVREVSVIDFPRPCLNHYGWYKSVCNELNGFHVVVIC